MLPTEKLNLVCAGFPRCGTTALAKYIEEYTNVRVLRDPHTSGYEYNGLVDRKTNRCYQQELLSSEHIFHKFSGYTYIKTFAAELNAALTQRPNTALVFMLGNPYERLQSWHAFHRSKAIDGTDKSHFTYESREFYADCSLDKYYQEFAARRVDYSSVLKEIVKSVDRRKVHIVMQSDLRNHPEKILSILSKQLGFEVYPIKKHILANSTIRAPGVEIAVDSRLEEVLDKLHSQTVLWAKEHDLLAEINRHGSDDCKPAETTPTIHLKAGFRPVKLSTETPRSSRNVLVIGNGPSASLIDFEFLKVSDISTCGMNSAYRLWEKIDFRPTYYICMDSVVIKSHAPAISRLIEEGRVSKFFLRNEFLDLYPQHQNNPRVTWFDEMRSSGNPMFTTNWITTGSWALRWMIDLDYKLIASIGIDANYEEIIDGATKTGGLELAISSTPRYNPNYFFDDYQQAGDEYNIPNDPKYVEKHGTTVHADAVIKVREDVKKLKLQNQIFDLSPLSAHNAFPKVPIKDFLSIQRISLTTSFCVREGQEDEARLNASALCHNLVQTRISSIHLLLEGSFTWFYELLDAESKSVISTHLSNGKLAIVPISKRPSYYELFDAARHGASLISVVANSDLIYDDTLIEAICTSFAVQSPKTMYCLTRWNKTEKGAYLQGQVPAPPWQELSTEEMATLSDVNYLSYDTYVFNKNLPIPDSLSKVYIGTFGCDTAIAAIFRASGVIVFNPCLDLKTIHIDNKPRNYSGEVGTKQVIDNVGAFKLALTDALADTFPNDKLLQTLEQADSTSLSIGTPSHSLGWWYCMLRMFGATPWRMSSDRLEVEFEKFKIDPSSLISRQDDLSQQLEDAMARGCFLEIVVDGSNGSHYLGCFNQTEKLKEIKEQLFRYDRQYVLFEQDVDERTRRAFDKFMLFVKNQILVSSQDGNTNLYGAGTSSRSSTCNAAPSLNKQTIAEAVNIGSSFNYSNSGLLQLNPPIDSSHRLLVIDPTPFGSSSATGQIKKTLFGHKPLHKVLQVWEHTGSDPGLRIYKPSEGGNPDAIPSSISEDDVISALREFCPTIVYFRSTASRPLHLLHHRIVSKFNIPSILHIMDDWESRMLWDQSAGLSLETDGLLRLLRHSIDISCVRLSICKQMSIEFSKRYRCSWIDLSNAVDLESFQKYQIAASDCDGARMPEEVCITYMGGIAEDMNSKSIYELAQAIDQLSSAGVKVRFNIYTMEWYMDWAHHNLSSFNSVTLNPLVAHEEYQRTLASSDILIIAYNFDKRSIAYTRLSMANKLPEILATGKLLFAYGPKEIATIDQIINNNLGVVVSVNDADLLKKKLREAIVDANLRDERAKQAIAYARRQYSLMKVRRKVNAILDLAMAKTRKHD